MITQYRAVTVAAVTVAVVLAGCSAPATHDDRGQHGHVAPATSRPPSASAPVISSASLQPSHTTTRSTAVRRTPISVATMPDPETSTATPITVAKAWAIAANSASYLDPAPGSWTTRATSFVTGTEAAAERRQRNGRGGSTWRQIQVGKCVTGLRDLVAGIPDDAPAGPDRYIVDVTAITAMSCTTGQIQMSAFAAQLMVIRVHGRWLVAEVHH